MKAIAFAATIATAAPAFAQDSVSFPSVRDGRGPLTITLAPSDQYAAEVHFQNELVYMYAMPGGPYILELDGLRVTVDLDSGPGDEPDRLTVMAPPGYVAIPPEIVVGEQQAATVIIQEFAGM